MEIEREVEPTTFVKTMTTEGIHPFMCGVCHFTTVYLVSFYQHLVAHVEGGNFYYNHATKTGYPKRFTTDASCQTEPKDGVYGLGWLNPLNDGQDESPEGSFYTERIIKEEICNVDDWDTNEDERSNTSRNINSKIKSEMSDDEYIGTDVLGDTSRVLNKSVKWAMPPRKRKGLMAQEELCETAGHSSTGNQLLSRPSSKLANDNTMTLNKDGNKQVHQGKYKRSSGENQSNNNETPNKRQKRAVQRKEDVKYDEDTDNEWLDEDWVKELANNCLNKAKPAPKPKREKRILKSKGESRGSKPSVKIHMKIDKKQDLDKCRENQVDSCHLCMEQFIKKQPMYNHMETVHDSQYQWKCQACFIPFIHEESYQKHMKYCKPENQRPKCHACYECGNQRLFLSRENLIQHIKSCHEGRFPFTCGTCDTKIVSMFDERLHKATHDNSLKTCRYCGFLSISLYEHESHLLSHEREYPYTCFICEKEFESALNVQYHGYIHFDKDGSIICEVCGDRFSRRGLLTAHKKNCQKRFRCEICHKFFANNPSLKQHLLLHDRNSASKPYICDQCGASFNARNGLKSHQANMHDDKKMKRYICNVCNKSFYSKSIYSRHCLIHENVTPYSCGECGKKFRTKWNLSAHSRQHTGEKPYSCSKCGLAFTHNVVRKNHEKNCEPPSLTEYVQNIQYS